MYGISKITLVGRRGKKINIFSGAPQVFLPLVVGHPVNDRIRCRNILGSKIFHSKIELPRNFQSTNHMHLRIMVSGSKIIFSSI